MLLICAASSGKNLDLAQHLLALAQEASIEAELLDLTLLDLPLYSPRVQAEGMPAALDDLAERFRAARGLFFCAPEYNGSIPPVLTNAIAWLSVGPDDFRELFNAKPVGLATHSGGGGNKVTLAMRQQLSHLGCNVIGRELLTSKTRELNEDSARALLAQLADRL
jgi:NAD(P)H-dependent FMN reductase